MRFATFSDIIQGAPEGSKQYQLKKCVRASEPCMSNLADGLHRYAEATLGSGNLRLAVELPEGEDINEWLAVNSACARVTSFAGARGRA
jgi:hypothetical protein